jgi:hypothetical protein
VTGGGEGLRDVYKVCFGRDEPVKANMTGREWDCEPCCCYKWWISLCIAQG